MIDADVDQTIRLMGAEFLQTVRTIDKVIRWRDAQFLLILPETPLQGAEIMTSCAAASAAWRVSAAIAATRSPTNNTFARASTGQS